MAALGRSSALPPSRIATLLIAAFAFGLALTNAKTVSLKTCTGADGRGLAKRPAVALEGVQVTVQSKDGQVRVGQTEMKIKEDPESCKFNAIPSGMGAGKGPGKAVDSSPEALLPRVLDRLSWRNEMYGLEPRKGEHPCFAGFESMMEGDRCPFQRTYPDVGGKQSFINRGTNSVEEYTLHAVYSDVVNLWVSPQVTPEAVSTIAAAARIWVNEDGVHELAPSKDSRDWLSRTCSVLGQMPFMYTCSKRVNLLASRCGFANLFPWSSLDFLSDFPNVADKANTNGDLILYVCEEFLEAIIDNPNLLAAAYNSAVAIVVQEGLGFMQWELSYGGATWAEGALVGNPPRPMHFFRGLQSYPGIFAEHIYTSSWRKTFQFHSHFFAYLSQKGVLGEQLTAAMLQYQNYFDPAFGRGLFDYFLQFVAQPAPTAFEPITLNVDDAFFPLADAMLDWRVAIVAQCIDKPRLRPTEARYRLPKHMQDHPFWDCYSFDTFWSADGTTAAGDAPMQYLGAAAWRLSSPSGATVSIPAGADAKVRTKVLAAGDGHMQCAEVRELRPGESASFVGGPREIFVVQVNADPLGEVLTEDDLPAYWQTSGAGWKFAGLDGGDYPGETVQGLRTPTLSGLPAGASLTFAAAWQLEAEAADGTKVKENCFIKGYDGVQVRVHSLQGGAQTITVIEPAGGYGTGPGQEIALYAFLQQKVYTDSEPCSSFSGWTGSSAVAEAAQQIRKLSDAGRGAYRSITFDLSAFEGQDVVIEFLFASDQYAEGPGWHMENIKVSAGGADIFVEDTTAPAMVVKNYVAAPPAGGSLKPFSEEPVLASYPEGHYPDTSYSKKHATKRAPWIATWPEGGCAPRRAHVGYPLVTLRNPLLEQAILRQGQELCVRVEAPVLGYVDTATLLTQRAAWKVSQVTLALRRPEAPFRELAHFEQRSASPGPLDPAVHRFDQLPTRSAIVQQGEHFLMCVGLKPTGGAKGEAYIEMPLTELDFTPEATGPGATFYLEGHEVAAGDKDFAALQLSLAVQAEIVECSDPLCHSVHEMEGAISESERLAQGAIHRAPARGWISAAAVGAAALIGAAMVVRRLRRPAGEVDGDWLAVGSPEEGRCVE